MNTEAIRDQLYDYIRVADDKKIRAIYTMLEDSITEKVKWWNDNVIMDEFQKRYDDWDTGKEKSYLIADIVEDIKKLKEKRASR